MRYEGKIVKWHDDKGFGFIRATKDSKDVFLHISQIKRLKKRPEIDEIVSYEIAKDDRGRFRAEDVSYRLNQVNQVNLKKSSNSISLSKSFLIFIFIFFAFVIERSLKGFLPLWFPFVFMAANLIAFLHYYQDKTSALKNNWRTPESTLHWFSLIGGWGGAYIAQKIFKHKHKKQSFMFTYKLTVLLNCLVIVFYSTPQLTNRILTLVSNI